MTLLILLGLAVAVVGLAPIQWDLQRNAIRRSGWTGALAVLPPAAALVLFFSLAAHMHRALGAWPSSLGDAGFPAALAAHAHLAQQCFGVVVASTLFALPVVAVLCLCVPAMRRWLRVVGVHGAACSACFAAMLLAPADFLAWWWD